MGLLSIFKRQAESPRATSTTTESGDEVQRARTRARRRLIGAAVLLGIGIVGFPLVFETQPRPIPVNIPIETPSKEGAPPLAIPAARPAAPATTSTAAVPAPAPAPSKPVAVATAPAVITEAREDAGREIASTAASAASAPARAAASKPAPAASKPAAEPKAAAAEAKPATSDAARARALLEGKPEAAGSDGGRFVVQVGAFADVAAAHETRAKVEKLGLKTYTQVASTASGKRIRVRAGPYNSRAEADAALAKARAAGLAAVVLTL
jgi:DedD protein